MRGDFTHEFPVAVQTIGIEHGGIDRPYVNRLVKILQGECSRMVISVARLCHPFPDEILLQMTLIACGKGVVAGLVPTVKLVLHDMAVDAGVRIAGEIGKSFGIIEGVAADAQKSAGQN